jgi:Uma2 family endonuclease
MSTTTRWTSADLEALPDDGNRYEIIDGELYMSTQPHFFHQFVCSAIVYELRRWNKKKDLGEVVIAPGLVFADDDDVAPDVVWISSSKLASALWPDGHLHEAPELVVEVLSPGPVNERRDRVAKLDLYSRRGVSEYWIVSWQARTIDVFRSNQSRLTLVRTLGEIDKLTSPFLPGFSCSVSDLFERIPIGE